MYEMLAASTGPVLAGVLEVLSGRARLYAPVVHAGGALARRMRLWRGESAPWHGAVAGARYASSCSRSNVVISAEALHPRPVSADTCITRLHVQQQSRRVPHTPPARPRQWRCLGMTSVPAPPLDWAQPDGRRDRAQPAQLSGSPALRPEEG